MKKTIVILGLCLSFAYTQTSVASDSIILEQESNSLYAFVSLGFVTPSSHMLETTMTATSSSELNFNDGVNLCFAIGKEFNNYRVEAEYSHRKLEADNWIFRQKNPIVLPVSATYDMSGKQTHNSLMFNTYWQPKKDWKISPFIGAGLGLTRIAWNDVLAITNGIDIPINGTKTVFTYQIIFGAGYKLPSNCSLEASYKYIHSNDMEAKESLFGVNLIFTDQQFHVGSIGIKYNF